LPKNEGDLNIEEKLKIRNSWQNSSLSATIHAAIVVRKAKTQYQP